MVHSELQRFASAIKAQPALVAQFQSTASPAEFAARLQAAGYDVTTEDVMSAISSGAEVSDQELDRINGGFWLETMIAFGIVAAIGVGVGWATTTDKNTTILKF